MTIDVEIISREIIKPAISVPDHLHYYKYSFVDQLHASAHYIPLIYFYSLDDHKMSNNEKSSHLKTSLSQVLNHYYPLTGVIKDNHLEYSKNGGVLVLEAQVNCHLQEILQSSHPSKFINKFLPDSPNNNSALAIQVNFFNCGGIAIGASIAHKIADALSFITFIKNWADAARGYGENVCPKFESATLFPPRPDWNYSGAFHMEKNVVLKRFLFPNSNISALREKYVISSSTEKTKKYPSRFEALTSFLFSRFVTSTKNDKGLNQSYLLSIPVNLRKRMDPPLSDDYFGNLIASAMSIITEEEVLYNHGIVNKLKEAISKINNYFVNKGNEDILNLFGREVFKEIRTFDMKDLVSFSWSSFCRYPIYEADFGWGRPLWVAFGNLSTRNTACFMDTRNGDGIEAWIHLTEEDMAKFESDKELLTYASPNPCP